jgi:hypothetical protein
MVGFREQEVFMPQVDPWEKAADCERGASDHHRSNPPRDPQQYPGILDRAGARESRFLSEDALAAQIETIGRLHAKLDRDMHA